VQVGEQELVRDALARALAAAEGIERARAKAEALGGVAEALGQVTMPGDVAVVSL